MRSRARSALGLGLALLVLAATPALATFPFPAASGDPYDYTRLKITNGSCEPPFGPGNRPAGSGLPNNFDCLNDWKLTDYRARPGDADYDPAVANNPQELNGIQGPATNRAWEVTTGRPDTVIAVMDSGIRWDEDRRNLVNKFYLNRGELPVPGGSAKGGTLQAYDANDDGVFNVKDYAGDPDAADLAGDFNSYLDPSDLIRTFSDGVDDDGNGYVDDISGWDFFEDDNDANDDVDYGHGTGESEDSAGETEINLDPQCPNCMLLEMRVGDSFVADINHFAEAVIYAVDNGASVVQEALGTLNHTGFAQAAVDYAYQRGVLIVASQADESAGHHNFPAALNHTMLVNSVTKYLNEGGVAIQQPKTFLSFNGCTNFGGYSWVTVASTSCSSDATAQAAGIAGLIYSAARNARQLGKIKAGPFGRPLSAEEAKQLFRVAALDVDFSTPRVPAGPPNNFATTIPASQRFVTTKGWDQITGWGRTDVNRAVRNIMENKIPPEADITSPRWWQPFPATGNVPIVGRMAAPRATKYFYRVEFAPGVQPPKWPATDAWQVLSSGQETAPKSGVLATLNLATVRAAINQLNLTTPPYTPLDDPTSKDLPEQDAFRVRVVVCSVSACPAGDNGWNVAIEQRQFFARADADLLPGWPKFLQGDGAASPAFADIDGDAKDEIVIADGNGFVHVYNPDGTEAPGFPVHTASIGLPATGTNAYTAGAVPGPVYAPVLLGSPLVADLDRDGDLEISVGDIEGNLHVWNSDGTARAGFPVRGIAAYSHEPGCHTNIGTACDDYAPTDVKNQHNVVDQAFTAMPSAGDLDKKYAGIEVVAGSNDGHVYAWHADGTPVPGWPVLIREPDYVKSVDPVSHRVTYTDSAPLERNQRKIITTPSLADIDADGDLEVLVNANEQYAETPNWGERDALLLALAPVLDAIGSPPGNTRTYALHHNGFAHAQTLAHTRTAHPHDQAYVAGWPVPIGMVQTDLLPYVGEGSNGAPVAANVDGLPGLEIATASIGTPPYLLNANGTSAYGNGPASGDYLTMASLIAEFKSGATDGPSLATLGGGAFGDLGTGVSFAMGSTGLRRLLDVVLPEQQLLGEDHLGVWDARTGTYAPGFPAQMNDLMFFNTPAIADVTGDGLAEVLQSSAMYDLRAYGLGGVQAFNKFTGGWGVMTPAVGDVDGDGDLELAYATREGNLFVWRTSGLTCSGQEWPKYQHDLRNTGTYGIDARPPARILNLQGPGVGRIIRWNATGDDARCGTATTYDVRAAAEPVTDANWGTARQLQKEPVPGAPGTAQTYTVALASGTWHLAIQAIDEAGNRSPISNSVIVQVP